MRFRRVLLPSLLLTVGLAAWPTGPRSGANAQVAAGPSLMPVRIPAPQAAVSGDWGQVLTVTDKWIVLQNDAGQQFPVAVGTIRLFLMRWPTAPERLGPQSLVEVTGLDLGSYRAQTDHVDVYEGAAAQLVSPAVFRITGFGRVSTMVDYVFDAGAYGEPFPGVGAGVMFPGEGSVPPRLHAVGQVVNQVPLQIAVPGGSAVTILPSPNGLSMTQVTPGTYSMVRPGDIVYFVPSAANARSLALDQLIVYKAVPYQGGR